MNNNNFLTDLNQTYYSPFSQKEIEYITQVNKQNKFTVRSSIVVEVLSLPSYYQVSTLFEIQYYHGKDNTSTGKMVEAIKYYDPFNNNKRFY